jgi:alanine dehydrogenase
MFISKKEILKLKPKSLIIDVSCDENMGFSFAKPTTFENPMFKEKTIDYYGVDHTPSYLWESATRTISDAVISYLPNVILNKYSGSKGETLKKATNIRNGIIVNKDIILFQNRVVEYPHKIK